MQQAITAEQSRSFDKRGYNPNLSGGKMLREDNVGRPATCHRKFKDQEKDRVGRSTATQDHTEAGIRYTDHTAESSAGMKKYRGVYFNKTQGMWNTRVYIHAEKRQMSLGVYRTAEMAAVAFDTGFLFLGGESDGLNFPQFASLLPRPVSNSRKDIRSAAEMAAWYLAPQIIHGHIRREYLEASTVICAPTSAPTVLLTTGTITSRAQQQPEQIHDKNKEIRNNQQIPHAQPQSGSSTTACPRICSSCLIQQKYTPLNIIQAAAIRTSNPNSMEVEMESFDEDHATDDVVLIEYPVRHSPECVLLRPVTGVDIHREYIWKK